MAVIWGLLAALGWGVADLMVRFAGRGEGVYRTMLYGQLAGLALLLGWAALAGESVLAPLRAAPPPAWGAAVLSALVLLGATFCMFQGLTRGMVAVVAPVAATYGSVTALLSWLAGEAIGAVAAAGMTLAVAGVALATSPGRGSGSGPGRGSGSGSGRGPGSDGDDTSGSGRRTGPGLAPDRASGAGPDGRSGPVRGAPTGPLRGAGWAGAAALGYGAGFWVQGRWAIPALGPLVPVLVYYVAGVALLAAIGAGRGGLRLPRRGQRLLLLGTGSLGVAAYFAFACGLGTGEVAVVTVISSLASGVTVLLGCLVLGERPAARQWAGIAAIFAGVVLVQLGR